MQIDPIRSKITSEIKKVENARKHNKLKNVKSYTSPDTLNFSADAKRLSNTKAQMEVLSTQVSNEPEIRTNKVEEVKEKIKNGYYNSPEFIDKLTDKLLTFFNFPDSKK
jgi:anti-sigma28 factor (negative regulator of flagellin synthesis)